MQFIRIFTSIALISALVGLFGFNRQIRKLFSVRRNLLIISAICFIYFVSFRYVPSLIDMVQGKLEYVEGKIGAKEKWTRLFLTNMCPMLCILLPATNFSKLKKTSVGLSTWGILGSSLMMFQESISKTRIDTGFFRSIFIDFNGAWSGYWMLHFLLLILSIVTLVSSEISLKTIVLGYLYPVIFLLYLEILRVGFQINRDLMGAGVDDWSGLGVFNIVSSLTGLSDVYSMVLGYSVFLGINLVIGLAWLLYYEKCFLKNQTLFKNVIFKVK